MLTCVSRALTHGPQCSYKVLTLPLLPRADLHWLHWDLCGAGATQGVLQFIHTSDLLPIVTCDCVSCVHLLESLS